MHKRRTTIGVSGIEGSFSEEAGRFYAKKHRILRPTFAYLVSVDGVLSALASEDIDIGIFPIENSNGGIVIEAVHAMAAHRFAISQIFNIEVHQNLLAKKGVTPAKITEITSHDQALKQCRMYLRREWPTVELVEYADTAKAAKDLADGMLPKTTAVIASLAAAKRYGLGVIEESVQDLKFNITTFIAAKRV